MKANANCRTATTTTSHVTEQRPIHLPKVNETNFARQLRALGQALERFSFSAFDIEIENGTYFVVAKGSATGRKGSLSVLRAIAGLFRRSGPTRTRPDRPMDLRFTPEEIETFDWQEPPPRCRQNAAPIQHFTTAARPRLLSGQSECVGTGDHLVRRPMDHYSVRDSR